MRAERNGKEMAMAVDGAAKEEERFFGRNVKKAVGAFGS